MTRPYLPSSSSPNPQQRSGPSPRFDDRQNDWYERADQLPLHYPMVTTPSTISPDHVYRGSPTRCDARFDTIHPSACTMSLPRLHLTATIDQRAPPQPFPVRLTRLTVTSNLEKMPIVLPQR